MHGVHNELHSKHSIRVGFVILSDSLLRLYDFFLFLNVYKKYKKICIAGFAFKNYTSVTERSYGLILANLLIKNKIKFSIYENNFNKNDPICKKFARFLIKKNKINTFNLIINTNSLDLPRNKVPTIDLWKL